jgi:hypothetical protein
LADLADLPLVDLPAATTNLPDLPVGSTVVVGAAVVVVGAAVVVKLTVVLDTDVVGFGAAVTDAGWMATNTTITRTERR